MKRFYKFLTASFIVVMLMPLWHGSEIKAWVPWDERYATFIHSFAVDKVWKFSNSEKSSGGSTVGAGTSLVDHPGTIAWCFVSWVERNNNSDDHDMEWFRLFLTDKYYDTSKNSGSRIEIAQLHINIDDDSYDDNNGYPRKIDNYNGCSSYCVQARWYDKYDGAWYVYVVTEYSQSVRDYITSKGSNLCLLANTRWDDNHWNTYLEKSDPVESTDRKFLTPPDNPSASEVAWLLHDNKTAIKYKRSVPSGCQLRTEEFCNGYLAKDYGWQDVNSGITDAVYLYPFDQSRKPSMSDLSGTPLTYYLTAKKSYKADQSYYSYHGGRSGLSATHTLSSGRISFSPPKFAQPKDFSAVDEKNGTITLRWNLDNTDGDNGNFVIERSYDEDFSQVAMRTTVAFDKGTTTYKCTDTFDDRNKGEKKFNYRIYREHASVNDLKCTLVKNVNTDYTTVIKADAEPTGENNGVTIKWELSTGIWDVNTMRWEISCSNGSQTKSGSDIMTHSHTFTGLQTCKPTTFTVRILTNGIVQSSVTTLPIILPSDRIGLITAMQPSCGYFNDHITLNWKVDPQNNNFNYFHVLRTEYGGSDSSAESLATIDFTNGVTEYTYDDKSCVPGTYYIYSVRGYSQCDSEVQMQTSKSDVGFAQPFGVISGQIIYNGNQGVRNAAVHAVGNDTRRGYSLYFKKDGVHKSTLNYPAATINNMLTDAVGTVEMFVKREGETAFRHLATTYQNGIYTSYIDGVRQNSTDKPVWFPVYNNDWSVAVYDDSGLKTSGFIDEIRIWNIYRDSTDIAKTMNCYLNGTELGLKGYYRCDDNIPNRLFDISRTGNTFNANHVSMQNVILDEYNIPSIEQLSLRSYTDDNGNYLITNIPYSVKGSLYNVIPTLGVHEFNPASRPLFFNSDATTHNSIDFTDVSSFPVSGQIFYEGTDYPVQGCNFYVDGNVCTEDNNIIESKEDGTFTISVPIGNHYIEVRKANHTFLYGGRYPESDDGTKTTFNFQKPVNNLTFYDNTLVTLTGRVAGGTEQEELPHGMQQGKANIGQAHVVISPVTKQKYNLNTSETTIRNWAVPESCVVASNAYTNPKQGAKAMHIAIDTDPMTGEFSVRVPPIDMTVDTINIKSNPDIKFELGLFNKIELSKLGDSNLRKDSMLVNSTDYRYFEYTDKFDAIYRVNPELIITDTQYDNGMMGIKQYLINDAPNDTVYTVDVFEFDSITNKWKYNFEVPFFLQGNTYVWHLRAFERYVNKDKGVGNEVADSVALKNSVVTLYNQIGIHEKIERDTTIVTPSGDSIHYYAGDIALEANQVQLDSISGCAYYVFTAGDPLKTEPYRLGLTITYTDSKHTRNYDWSENGKFQGVVLGSVSEGTNFITEGPDHVLFVLRDPPGGGSYATFKEESKITGTNVSTKSIKWSTGTDLITSLGASSLIGTGMGVMVIQDIKAKDQVTTGGEYHGHKDYVHTEKTTYVTTRQISTESDIHHVGSSGDVYVGYSTNRTFGEATMVTIMRDALGNYSVGSKPVICVGEKFKTDFTFSQQDLEDTQIPNLKKLRNNLLTTVTQGEYDNPKENTTEDYVYITTRDEKSSDFGEEGTYKAIPPLNAPEDVLEQNMVLYYNCQINNWKNRIADNERAKLGMLFDDVERKLIKNISVDGGVTLTESATTSALKDEMSTDYNGFEVILKNSAGFKINGIGEEWNVWTKDGEEWGEGSGSSTETTTTTSYTFDLNPYEQLSVNVYDLGDGYSPAFSVVGGQTACPYEGEEKTKYFEPGEHVLNVSTQKMEDPLIHVEGPSAYSAIPIGGSATYTLQVSNQTVVSSPVNMRLRLMEGSNPDGALLYIDGMPLTSEGTIYHLTGNTVITKSLTLKQGSADKLDYKNIGIILSSDCAARSVADTAYISATFIPSCSAIALTTDSKIVNMNLNGKLAMTISGYDYNLTTLKECRLQYKQPTEISWTSIKEFSKEEMKDGTIHYTWDTNGINDGLYEVRAITVCNLGGQDVINESESIAIIKDMTPPQALGLPSPINGIYTADNQIYVDFNKDIQTGRITSSCIDVNGMLNSHEQKHSVGVYCNGQVAYSEAEYDLSNTSFAFEAWINWSVNGLLLFHTGDGLQLEILEDGRLRVNMDSLKWISTQTMPKNEWLYFVFNYELQSNGNGLMSVHCAYDDKTIDLFKSETVPAYDRRGMLVLFYPMLTLKMHDAILWNQSRDWATALSERNISKDAYTDGILSYWPMNEGDGKVAHDVVRHRDLTLSGDNMWWFNNENKALHIPEGTEAVIDFSNYPYTLGNDYLFSFWFRTSAPKEAPLFRTGNNSLSISIADSTTLSVKTSERTIRLNMGVTLNNGSWHHFAISSSHSFSPIIMIDGQIRDMATMDRQAFVTNAIYFSDLTSTTDLDIDEVSSWQANCSADYIAGKYRNQLNGDEPGLLAYFPMEETVLDEFQQVVTRFTLANKSKNSSEWGISMTLKDGSGPVEASEALTAPPIREVLPTEKVRHNVTASERRIVINITEEARRIEGCTLNISVKDIFDTRGNVTSSPINWSVYVNRNQLLWKEPSVRIAKNAIEESTFEVTIMNNGGKTESWELYNVPEWLTFSETRGVLQPLTSKTLTATISSALPIGSHQVTISLVGNEGINQPLLLTAKVNAERPDWNIDPTDYEYTMNMIAVTFTNGHMADDSEDMVAAFINDKVAGVGHPKLFPAYNSYLVLMDVYANLSEVQRDSIGKGLKIHLPVTFKFWDASNGMVYNNVSVQLSITDIEHKSIEFQQGKLIGAYNNPVRLTATNQIEQIVTLKSGWNWISYNALPENKRFELLLSNVANDMNIIKSQSAFAQFDKNHKLVGSLQDMEIIKAYKIQVKQPCKLSITGQMPNPKNNGISLTPNGWTWIGYLPQTTLSVNAALANLSPSVGDIVKAHSGFATWDGYSWIGSLTAMRPGEGYLYYNSTAYDATLYYPSNGALQASLRIETVSMPQHFAPVDPSGYQGNMTITAVVKDGSQIAEDTEIGVFAGDVCVSAAAYQNGYWFFTIPSYSDATLTFRSYTDGQERVLKQTVDYIEDATIGTPAEPYIIQIGEDVSSNDVDENNESGVIKYYIDGILYIEDECNTYNASGQIVK